LHESGGKEDLWTFNLAIGDEGDFFNLEVKGEDGSTKAKIHISADGQLTLLGTNGVHIINAGNSPSYEEVGSDIHRKYKASVNEEIEGPVTKILSSTKTEKISESKSVIVGHNDTRTVNNHQILSVGGRQEITVTGASALKASPLSIAVDEKILNGSYIVDVGNPLNGSTPAACAGYRVFVHNGEILFGADPALLSPPKAAYVSLNTLLPNSIGLGCVADTKNPGASSNPAVFHAALAEPLITLITTLIGLLDGHTHNVTAVGSPTGPALAPSNPGGFSSALSSSISSLQSLRVSIGA
jgi:hypothetical protein